MKVYPCPVSEILDDERFEELIAEYAAESKADEAPQYDPDRELYVKIESLGVLQAIKATHNDEMVGFAVVVLSQAPHYRDIIATTESLFVEKKMRVTGAGLALIRAAEEVALHKGCNALFVSAPAGGQLEKLMPKLKYRESHKVFARVL